METGSNIVEVPGSKSRKVAEKKQQWYRMAILKMFLKYYNLLNTSSFQNNLTVKFNVLDSRLFPESFFQYVKAANLMSTTDSISESVFSLKLQKTVRFSFFGNTVLLNKSYFSSLYNVRKIDFSHLMVSDRIAINLKNR